MNEQSAVVAWVAPPAVNTTVKYLADAESMRARPGEWAQFEEARDLRAAYSLADNIRRGRLVAFRPAGDFEATASQRTVFARYVGKEDS